MQYLYQVSMAGYYADEAKVIFDQEVCHMTHLRRHMTHFAFNLKIKGILSALLEHVRQVLSLCIIFQKPNQENLKIDYNYDIIIL
jgi:hypothetical protein